MTNEETWDVFISEWERRLNESGVIVGYSDCFGAGLLMEELCFGVGTIKLDKMVTGWDSERSEGDTLSSSENRVRDGRKLQNIIIEDFKGDLTTSFPLDRLRRLNENETPQKCDMRMIKVLDNGLTALYWNGSAWVSQKPDQSIGVLDEASFTIVELGTFRPVNFDG